MALSNSLNFLPPVFRSPTNQRFLGATIDQLVTDAVNVPLKGYIGRKFAPTYRTEDNYIPEPTTGRQNYQLEASVVVTDNNKNVKFNAGYIDLLNSIDTNNGLTNNQTRLFAAESYQYDGKFDYDKFVNYYNYYWLPNGPSPVTVSANNTPYEANYNVTRNSAIGGYVFSGLGTQPNLPITVARGGTYTFAINQPGANFWIQTEPGVSGHTANVSTVSTRQVFGVTNNGTDNGVVTFTVPQSNAQDVYATLPTVATVDVAIDNLKYTDIQGMNLTQFLAIHPYGFDGVNHQLNTVLLIFVNNLLDDSAWTVNNVTVPHAQRTNTWTISLVPSGSDYTINLIPSVAVTTLQKVFVTTGLTYASNQFWLDNNFRYDLVPINTAIKDYLYYQDASNPNFIGVIKIVDNSTSTIDVNVDILGKTGYVSPNGVGFTNGLKVIFDTSATPITYTGNEYYVEGVGTSIALVPVAQLAVPESFSAALGIAPVVSAGAFVVGSSYTILSIGTTNFTLCGAPANQVGLTFNATGIGLGSGTAALVQISANITADYITVNRASQDLNAWTRSNRWFHVDVINAVATHNKTTADYGPSIPGRRPIIEFNQNLQLFNFGQKAGNNITYITFTATDAFANIEGHTTYTLDGYTLKSGDRIVFANDHDTSIVNEIWQVSIQTINNTAYITLVPTPGETVVPGMNYLVSGGAHTGKTFFFNGITWNQCQIKYTANQPPLFDLVDHSGFSFTNDTVYPSSTFAGSKLFGYSIPTVTAGSFVVGYTYKILSAGTTNFVAIGAANNNYGTIFTATGVGGGTGTCAAPTTNADALLGFPLTHQTFNNIGDIVFGNFYDADAFTYVANQVTTTVKCNTGYMAINNSPHTVTKVNNWVVGVEKTDQDQIFTAFFKGLTLSINGVDTAFVEIDVLPMAQATIPTVKVYQNNTLLKPVTDYQLVQYGVYNIITLTTMPALNDKIDVAISSNAVSNTAYYEVPDNLDLNALNENFDTITLGQLRNHYNKLIENTSISTTGNIPLQDRNLKSQVGTIVQHQAPIIYAMTFLNDPTVNFVNGLSLARKEYAKFKNKFLSLCSSSPTINYNDPVTGVDIILQGINGLKNGSFPWFYSDMVPYSGTYTTVTYNVINARQTQYEINSIFDTAKLSNRAVIVYVNGVQKTLGVDYTFSPLVPAVMFTNTFKVGDVITIRDYPNTDGNYIPETPTKLGLFPKFTPMIYLDDTYQTPTNVIRGHDGSLTPAFNDYRDQYLLELELRIYNNIKSNYDLNRIDLDEVIPGKFRTINYTRDEYLSIMAQNFLEWAGTYNVNYTENNGYDVNNPWTWNYSQFTDVVNGSYLQGYWRSIYEYWFDTSTPHLTPWKMLGFSSMPTWWTTRYGPTPYTRGNTLLWEDIQNGYIWNGGVNPVVDVAFARPGLTGVIPVDSAGNLLDPTAIPLVSQRNIQTADAPFQFGQGGPAETAWHRSSDYPYAVQLLIALTKPARYFATQLDTAKFYANPVTGQFSDITNQRITPSALLANGDTDVAGSVQRTAGYINWIGDSIKNLGINPIATLTDYFKNFSVQLNYKVAGFTDHRILTVLAEQTSPGAKGSSIIIPNDSVKIYLNKSVPVATATYSAVIIEKTNNGYAVSGYGLTNPSFTIIPSIANGNAVEVTINGTTVPIYQDSTNTTQSISYGTVFTTVSQVADFLISYQRYLVSQGFVFNQYNTDLNAQQDWELSVKELIYWSQQGWAPGTVIVLNPISTQLQLQTTGTVVDEITNTSNGNKLLDENFNPIKNNNFNIVRTDDPTTRNAFNVTAIGGSTIAYAKLNLVQYEHVLIFDNVDDFGDIIYIPNQGTRQYRLELSGSKTGKWDGALSATGYIYNNPTIQKWTASTDYKFGDIVLYNNFHYTATQNIPASTTFNSLNWSPVTADEVKTGLLPSFGLNAQEFVNFYDVDNPPQDSVFQQFSSGLIGFRQRSYLTDLGISVPTQTKFYQGFIKQKGTMNAITALTRANFNNVGGNVNVYEEWAFRNGTYGGINNNQFKEFVLDQSVFNTNPVAFTIANTYSTANIIANLTLGNIYNSSNLASNVNAVYSNRVDSVYIDDLPSVGYVNLNDVDYTQFDIANPTLDITNVGVGNKIWVAKNASGNWGIYRVTETNITAIALTYILDNFAQLKFSDNHPFKKGDIFILKYFNPAFDGVHNVVNVPNGTSITISLSTVSSQAFQLLLKTLTLSGAGTAYRLATSEYPSISFVSNTSATPPAGWIDNDRVWIDNASLNGWGVYTHVRPWLSNTAIRVTANTVTPNAYFGNATRISTDTNTVYIGNPGNSQVQIMSNVGGTYVTIATLSNVDSSFGTAIESQGNLLVVGAPTSANVHIYQGNVHIQMIHSPNALGQFGQNISMSADQHWLYIGEPTTGNVQAYWSANTAANVSYTYISTLGTGTGQFGQTVKTNNVGNLLIVSAPQANTGVIGTGNVYVYNRTGNAFSIVQTITAQHQNSEALFGTGLDIDFAGGNLYIGAPGSTESGFLNGAVERYVLSGGTYTFQEYIAHPIDTIGTFGISVSVSADTNLLAVGSLGSPTLETTTFDNASLIIDSNATKFIEAVANSGATYLFEPLINQAVANDLGRYVFTQELQAQMFGGEQFGYSVDVARGVIAVGAPGYNSNQGTAYIFTNPKQATAWNQTRTQQPTVDIDSISRTLVYNKSTNNLLAALDYIDPAKGKVLTTVDQDIDFKLVKDPAFYNAGTGATSADLYWGPGQVGTVWWDLDTVRYINYEQDSLIYRLTHWGTPFPGSSIDVYQWIESPVLPGQYNAYGGQGMPLHTDNSAYSTYGYVNPASNVPNVRYYFWVKNLPTVAKGKNSSVLNITTTIANPQATNIPYATVLRNDTVALYNVTDLLVGKNSVIQIGSQIVAQNRDPNIIHSEYALVQEGNPASAIPQSILIKFADSLSGVDAFGKTVPDPTLIPSQAYGIGNRPRQSMIMNRSLALQNALAILNPILASYPIVENKVMTTLNSGEPVPNPSLGLYSLTVATISELSYVDVNLLAPGYNALVTSDSTHQGQWAIYTLNAQKKFVVSRVQSFLTSLYWTFADWFASNYDPTTIPDVTVANRLEFGKLTLQPNTNVKIISNGDVGFVIYHIDANLNQTLVGIQNGTIQISTGTIPSLELRQIIVAMNTEILIDDLATELNNLFFSMIKYILTEQKNIDWAFKTSFISTTQSIRKLQEFPAYIPDNQHFYLDYINEVKPYRTEIREFVANYLGNDQFSGDVTDFDLQPYWDANLIVYRSPNGDQTYDAALVGSPNSVYSQWYQHHKYDIAGILVQTPGTDYILPPSVTIEAPFFANGLRDTANVATAYATINSSGGVNSVIMITEGKGYTFQPNITFNGTGVGASGYAILKEFIVDNIATSYNLVRSISTTMKFDRTAYTNPNTFVNWSTITTANIGQVISANVVLVLNNQLYQLANSYTIVGNVTTGVVSFPFANVAPVSASSLSTATDRIVAFNGNIDLDVMPGIGYPGVIVDGNAFVGNVYDIGISSTYTANLGLNPADIFITGGAYYDIYNSHAPEELIPGRTYDSLAVEVHDTQHLGFRTFMDSRGVTTFNRMAAANTTVLSANLTLIDDTIHVANALALPPANVLTHIPGVVFVNGEQITYWRNYAWEPVTVWSANTVFTVDTLISNSGNTYLTTGNVYAPFFANVTANVNQIDVNSVTHIRRGVDRTFISNVQPVNSLVVDSSIQQAMPGIVSGIVTLTSNTVFTTSDVAAVSYIIHLSGNISANIGDTITQLDANANVIATMRSLQTVSNSSVVPVIITSGALLGLPEQYDTTAGFDMLAFSDVSASLNVNSVQSDAVVINSSIIGKVNSRGQVTIPFGTTLLTDNSWYTPGVGTPGDGNGLFNSTTAQVTFLKASLD